MIEIGRICYKIAGRESGKVAVVVDKINDNFVFVDGQVKRKRCNIWLTFNCIVTNFIPKFIKIYKEKRSYIEFFYILGIIIQKKIK